MRSLRLYLIVFSFLPFIAGAVYHRASLDSPHLYLASLALLLLHISANLINDYYDAAKRVDWQDMRDYYFFGGSRLIQDRIVLPAFLFKKAVVFLLLSFIPAGILFFMTKDTQLLLIFMLMFTLSWSYSAPPLFLSYRYLGAAVQFICFGPLPAMFAASLPSCVTSWQPLELLLMTAPMGLFAVIFFLCNSAACSDDCDNTKRRTLATLVRPQNVFIVVILLALLAMGVMGYSIFITKKAGLLTTLAVAALLPLFKVVSNIQQFWTDKNTQMDTAKINLFNYVYCSTMIIVDQLAI